SEHGIQDLTIKNLAKRIDLSEPAIYRHFESKHDILLAILRYFGGSTKGLFTRVLAMDIDPLRKIERVFMHHFQYFAEHPSVAAVIFSEEIFQNDRKLAQGVLELMNQTRAHILEIVEAARQGGTIAADVPAEHLTIVIMGSLRFIVTRWRLSEHSFDLVAEGQRFWRSLAVLLESGRSA
ncbi:MAG: TetR family transcriptional regulator, partial [Chitinivibrionales bacterium]|nr:TetR family transcriptional regulator [Chitinivibrionales bacterium]